MNQSEFQEVHLLNLPDEIFLHIFSYVNISWRENVAQVCKRFYELMCVVERDCFRLELSYSKICDEEIRRSIVNSSREFEDLTIDLHGNKFIEMKHVEDVILKFGKRIKRFELKNFDLSESELRRIFDCIPNVENLVLDPFRISGYYKSVINSNIDISEPNLCKLKKLTIEDWSIPDMSDILPNILPNILLNAIPKDSIKELIISIPVDMSWQEFFNQQTNIKFLEMSTTHEYKNQVKFDHLKLEHLKLGLYFDEEDVSVILRQQPGLRYFEADFSESTDHEILTALCDMNNLEILSVNLDLPYPVFQSLKYLTHLKELELGIDSGEESNNLLELSRMHLNIEKLILSCEEIPPGFFIQMIQNFRKLKHIKLWNRYTNIINTILENFPNLESIAIEFDYRDGDVDVLVIDENLRHEKLEEMIMKGCSVNVDNTRALLSLLNVCPNVERIMLTTYDFYDEDMQQIINDHPKLTHLKIVNENFKTKIILEDETIDCIRTAASRLKFIELYGFLVSPESSLKTLFKDEFNYFRCQFYKGEGNEYTECHPIMKKRNVSKWNFRWGV
ncbi:CLUMA_CG005570, isoform A [Clunio marinus]|uniref:CLUMA_CG005570, isoform A n=1 Tax=Clunio marinus TaxID=568069 RepID=A0A1J1HZM2_9DIPT|nr:CLUMA_CG005570, isoform A [Clunio marinus]